MSTKTPISSLASPAEPSPTRFPLLCSDSDPYYIDTIAPETLPKTSFVPYHPIMSDLDEWPTANSQNTLSPTLNKNNILISPSASSSLPTHPEPARISKRSCQPPTWLQEYFVNFIEGTSEPSSFQTTTEDPSRHSAMAEEITTIQKNHTWTLTTLPPGKTPISTKWVYKTKLRPNGSIQRKKARLFCRSYEQREGMSY
jgi:hypothetical protein